MMSGDAKIRMNTKVESRRNFLQLALTLWATILCLPLLYVIGKYIVPPKLRERLLEIMNLGKVSDVPPDSAKIVRFNKQPIVIVRTGEGQVKAFSAVCTHLGCIIEYRPEDKNFHCNCHGSMFNLDGKNIGGPAQRPLPPYRVEIKDDQIFLSKV